MLAATVIQYSVPAAVSGSPSAMASSTTTLNMRCRSETVEIQPSRPDADSAANAPPSAPRRERNTAPA